jgi:hypothetical protein
MSTTTNFAPMSGEALSSVGPRAVCTALSLGTPPAAIFFALAMWSLDSTHSGAVLLGWFAFSLVGSAFLGATLAACALSRNEPRNRLGQVALLLNTVPSLIVGLVVIAAQS